MLCLSFLTLVHVLPFVLTFVFHHSRCDPALPVFASRCLHVSRYALTACAMWSRGSWRGYLWFPHGTLLLHSLAGMAWWSGCLVCCFAIPYGDDTKLSPLASINPFPYELEPVTMLFCLCWLFFFVWFVSFFFVFCVLLVFLFCFFCAWVITLWQYTGLRNGPPPVHFWGHSTADGLRMPWLIN